MGTLWGYADQMDGVQEGWVLRAYSTTDWEIRAIKFNEWSNEEATLYVAARAAEGSDLHKRAWALVTGSNQT